MKGLTLFLVGRKDLRISPYPLKAIVLSLFTATFYLGIAFFETDIERGQRLPVLKTNFVFTPSVGKDCIRRNILVSYEICQL